MKRLAITAAILAASVTGASAVCVPGLDCDDRDVEIATLQGDVGRLQREIGEMKEDLADAHLPPHERLERKVMRQWARATPRQRAQVQEIITARMTARAKAECSKLTGAARAKFSQCVIDFVRYEQSQSFMFAGLTKIPPPKPAPAPEDECPLGRTADGTDCWRPTRVEHMR